MNLDPDENDGPPPFTARAELRWTDLHNVPVCPPIEVDIPPASRGQIVLGPISVPAMAEPGRLTIIITPVDLP